MEYTGQNQGRQEETNNPRAWSEALVSTIHCRSFNVGVNFYFQSLQSPVQVDIIVTFSIDENN